MSLNNYPFWIENDSVIYQLNPLKNQDNQILGGVFIGNNKYRHPLTPTFLDQVMNYFNWHPQEYIELKQRLNYDIDFIKEKRDFTNHHLLAPHQIQAVEWIKYKKTCGLFWEMRAGKTYPSCEATKDYKKIAVLTQAGQNDNWVDAFNKLGRYDIHTTNMINKQRKKGSDRRSYYSYLNSSNNYVLVMNKETLTGDMYYYKDLVLRDLDYLIIDEAHYYKNNKSKLYQGAKKLRYQAKHCLVLTGTPTPNSMSDILPLFSLMFPRKFSKTYIQEIYFNFEYNEWSEFGTPTTIKKHKEKDWIEFLGLWFFQLKTQEVNEFSDEFIEKDILLNMTEKQKAVYEQMLFSASMEIDQEAIQEQNALTILLRLAQLSTCPNVFDLNLPNIKEEWIKKFLSLNQNRRVIIFSQYSTYLEYLNHYLNSTGYKSYLITGKTKNKVEIAKQFQSGVYNVLLGNIKAAGTGITLDTADIVIFLDRSWRPDENKQAMYRVMNTNRNIMSKKKYIYYLMIADRFKEMESIDFYMKKVNDLKLSNTEIINELKKYINLYRK